MRSAWAAWPAIRTACSGSGKYRATYTTFHRIGDGRCRFDGYCFEGENQNRVDKTYSRRQFEKCLAEARKEAEKHG